MGIDQEPWWHPRFCHRILGFLGIHSRQKSPTHVFSGQMNQSPAQVHPAEGRKLSLGSLIRPVTSEYLG